MIFQNVLDLIGNTPIVKLNHMVKPGESEVYVKLEGFNPGGSSKDRVAKSLIEEAEKLGKLKPGGTIIESSSGNLAIGLAMVARIKGYKMICVVDPKISEVNLSLIKAFGGEICMVDNPDEHGNYLKSRLSKVQELTNAIDNSYWPNQYHNKDNPNAYKKQLVTEIYNDFNGDLDWVICPVGTAGLITGVTKGLKEIIPNIKVMAVDAVGSVTFGGLAGKRMLLGIGNAIIPGNLQPELYDEIVHVSDADAFYVTRQLVSQEGLLVGGSSGATVLAAINLAKRVFGKKILVILPDRGDRYYNTIFSDEWLNSNDIKLSKVIRRDEINNSVSNY